MIEWIKVCDKSLENLKNTSLKLVMIDVTANILPFIGWYDPSPIGGGFYFKNGSECVRVMVSHFLILPEYPKNDKYCVLDEDEFIETLMKIQKKDL